MSDDGFDPRYDPAFQRGYTEDPNAPRSRLTGSRSRLRSRPDASASSPVLDDRAAAELFPDPPGDPMASESARPARTPEPTPDPLRAEPTAVDAVPLAARAPLQLRGNPFVVALWVATIVLVVGGVAAWWYGNTGFSSLDFTNPEDYFLPRFLFEVAPGMTVAGLLTGVGLLFLYAVTWRRRVDADDPE